MSEKQIKRNSFIAIPRSGNALTIFRFALLQQNSRSQPNELKANWTRVCFFCRLVSCTHLIAVPASGCQIYTTFLVCAWCCMWSGQPCAIFIPCAIESMFAFHSFINFSIFYLLFHAPSFAITHGLCDSDGISVYSTTYICIAPKWMVTYVASVYILPRWMSYFTLRCRRSRMYVRFAYGAIQPHTHTHNLCRPWRDDGRGMKHFVYWICMGILCRRVIQAIFLAQKRHRNEQEIIRNTYIYSRVQTNAIV